MATASDNCRDSISFVEEGLSCGICYNLLREPKELDCPHIYCLECIQDWTATEPVVQCPECQHITVVPTGGLWRLKTNFRLEAMAETYKDWVEKQKGVPFCPHHEGERQHFYCVTCSETVCHNCLVLKHPIPQHKIRELKEIAVERKKQANAKLDQILAKVEEVDIYLKRLYDVEKQVQAAVETALSDIDGRADAIIAQVEATRTAMKGRVNEIRGKHMKTVGDQRNVSTDLKKRLNNVQSDFHDIVDNAANHLYVKQHDSLVDKMEKLCITKHDTGTLDLACLHFNSGSDSVSPEWFGKVVESDHREQKLTLVTEFGAFEQAGSVAKTKTGLLAVVDKLEEVVIYRDHNGEYKRHMRLGDSDDDPSGKLTNPFKIAVTSDDKFLVSDNGQVKVFSSTCKFEKTLPIGGARIITTPDDRIVISSNIRRDITVYQSNGELLQTHTINSDDIQDIASNGKQIAYTTVNENKVCVIDIESGQELWSLDMTFPLGICYEQRCNSLLVAGGSSIKGNFFIQQRCSITGRLISRVASRLFNPFALTTTHDGLVLVADLGTVKVYKAQ